MRSAPALPGRDRDPSTRWPGHIPGALNLPFAENLDARRAVQPAAGAPRACTWSSWPDTPAGPPGGPLRQRRHRLPHPAWPWNWPGLAGRGALRRLLERVVPEPHAQGDGLASLDEAPDSHMAFTMLHLPRPGPGARGAPSRPARPRRWRIRRRTSSTRTATPALGRGSWPPSRPQAPHVALPCRVAPAASSRPADPDEPVDDSPGARHAAHAPPRHPGTRPGRRRPPPCGWRTGLFLGGCGQGQGDGAPRDRPQQARPHSS